jgi:hypothetical protein
MDVLLKHKEIGKLVSFLTELANATAGAIDTKIHQQAASNPIGIDLLTNYMAYMSALNLMVVKSTQAWMQRKLLKATKTGAQADALTSLAHALVEFRDAAESISKPLEYFSKLYNPKAPKESDSKVKSLSDILKIYNESIVILRDKYLATLATDVASSRVVDATEVVKAGILGGADDAGVLIKLGGGTETAWVGGMQTQTLLMQHMTKLELLRDEDESIVRDRLAAAVGPVGVDELKKSGLSLEQAARMAELDKPILLLKWELLEKQIQEYLASHQEKYSAYMTLDIPDSWSGGHESIGLFNKLEHADRAILLGMLFQKFKDIDDIDTEVEFDAAVSKLRASVETIAQHPNKRTEILSEMRYLYDELDEMEAIDLSRTIPISGDTSIDILESLVAAEVALTDDLTKLEKRYLDQATIMSKLKQLWENIISDDVKETCIKWTGLLLTSLLSLAVLEQLNATKFKNRSNLSDIIITEDHPRIDIYHDGIKKSDLVKLIESFI